MKHWLKTIILFRKRIWIPLVLLSFWFFIWMFLPWIASSVLGLAMQGLYVAVLMIGQVLLYFGFLFYYLAGRVQITLFMPGDLHYLSWDDWRGNPELVNRLKAITGYVKGVDEFREMGGLPLRGALFSGPPGTGKTYAAKIVAAEAGIPLFYIASPSLIGMFMGMSQLRLMRAFVSAINKAEENVHRASIMYFDEIDSIGRSRGGMGTTIGQAVNSFRSWLAQMPMFGGGGAMVLNTLLIEMDGLNERRPKYWRVFNKFSLFLTGKPLDWVPPNLLILAGTNRKDILDPALLRRGRFGRTIYFPKPTYDGRLDIAQYYLDKVKNDDSLTAEVIARTTSGKSPAFIQETLQTDTIMNAHQAGRHQAALEDWLRALSEGSMGERQLVPLTDKEKRLLACHEAGHTVVGLSLGGKRFEPIITTIIRYGESWGHAFLAEVEPWQIGRTQGMIEDAICYTMGGLVSERVFGGERNASVGGDLPGIQHALRLLLHSAMLDLWPWEGKEEDRNTLLMEKRRELEARTEKILRLNEEAVLALRDALLEKGELRGPEILKILEGKIKPWEGKDETLSTNDERAL